MCPSLIEIGSKTAEKNYAQTNRQTNRHYENNGHLVVNQKCGVHACVICMWRCLCFFTYLLPVLCGQVLFLLLQVGYDGDPEAALVSFASRAQASAAYRCSEPLFNNRFIKVFWHNPDRNNTAGGGAGQPQSQQVTATR